MKVLANNCVSKIEIPDGAQSGNGVAYNPILGLFVTMDFNEGISVWNPVSGEVIAECDLGPDGDLNMSLLPCNRIAVSYSEVHHGGSVDIHLLEKETFDSPDLELKVPSLTYSGMVALSPQKSLLVAGSVQIDSGLYEIFMDWENLRVLKMRELCINPEESGRSGIGLLCCSPDRRVIRAEYVDDDFEVLSSLSIAKMCDVRETKDRGNDEEDDEEDEEQNELEQVEMQEEATITHYMLDGVEKQIDNLRGLVHDGQNLIIADGDKIVLLESLTEGSKAHLIASGLKPAEQDSFSRVEVGLSLNHKGQLMVCDDKAVIKIFEYKCNPRSLQDICRCFIVNTVHTGYSDKVKSLTIPTTLKDYLLYK